MIVSQQDSRSFGLCHLYCNRGHNRKCISYPPAGILARRVQNDHTPSMTLKNAAVIALAGMLLLTALVVVDFIFNISNVLVAWFRRWFYSDR